MSEINSVSLELGRGNVAVQSGAFRDSENSFGILRLRTIDRKCPVGARMLNDQLTYSGNEINLLFENTKSIEVLIEGLKETKRYMENLTD